MRQLLVSVASLWLQIAAALAVESSVPFINADDVRNAGITGLGVTVALIDFGIDNADPNLRGSIARGGESIIGGVTFLDLGQQLAGDDHGTEMALIITHLKGVALNAKILSVRSYSRSDDILAINYVKNRRMTKDKSIRVINLI